MLTFAYQIKKAPAIRAYDLIVSGKRIARRSTKKELESEFIEPLKRKGLLA